MVNLSLTKREDDKVLVAVAGSLDTVAVDGFNSAISEINPDLAGLLTLDFSDLDYISSAGLRALLMLNREAAAKGGRVAVTGMNEAIAHIFRITGLESLF